MTEWKKTTNGQTERKEGLTDLLKDRAQRMVVAQGKHLIWFQKLVFSKLLKVSVSFGFYTENGWSQYTGNSEAIKQYCLFHITLTSFFHLARKVKINGASNKEFLDGINFIHLSQHCTFCSSF